MVKKKLPNSWEKEKKAVRAVQVAFDLEERLHNVIRHAACEKGISPSDQIRSVVELPVSRPPRRPRLTASFSPDDYQLLAKRYHLSAEDKLEIKRRVMQELVEFAEKFLNE